MADKRVAFNPHTAWAGEGGKREPASWIRNIVGIDENLAGGFSLLGEFVPRPRQGGAVMLVSGKLYLDCHITINKDVTRRRYYRLFQVNSLGTPALVAHTPDVKGWARSLWSPIRQTLGAVEYYPASESPPVIAPPLVLTPVSVVSGNPKLQAFTTDELIAEVRHRLALDALTELPL